MKKLYIDCSMGASGDMLTSALCSLLPQPEKFIERVNSIGLAGVAVKAENKIQYGVTGLHVTVLVNGEDEEVSDHAGHHHSSTASINGIIDALHVSEKVREDAKTIYHLIAEAEGKVHGEQSELVHFHEVGAMDAVTDVTAVCMLMEELGVDKFSVSPVRLGFGRVKCAHGVLPVPAPATAELIKGIDCYGGDIEGELCTPTGAALIKYFADCCGTMPQMKLLSVGTGIGSRDFSRCNCLRAFLGENLTDDATDATDKVVELRCNIDDMTGEAMGFAQEKLFEAGALDVFYTPIFMKKNRPAYMLSCLCVQDMENEISQAVFRYTSTIGIRKTVCERYLLKRENREYETSFGPVEVKNVTGFGIKHSKPEYEAVKRIADKEKISFDETSKLITNELKEF